VEVHAYPILDDNGEVIQVIEYSIDITERKQTQERLSALQLQLQDASRQAGMAEVATGVLHNVGNVLNSVNVSASVVADLVAKSKAQSLGKAAELVGRHTHDLATFITEDERGKHLPQFLAALANSLTGEQAAVLEELGSLTSHIEHIKTIVTTQQCFAGASQLIESISLADLLEDALRIESASLKRHVLDVQREYADLPPIEVDKQKLLQILINLIRNGKHAVVERGERGGQLILRTAASGDDRVQIEVVDDGVGIAAENLTQIFAHGFTTRQERGGRGFGLHLSALFAKEMGGSLTAHSDGPGTGATFVLELPLRHARAAR
jgi:signal transduction histidine kinase